MKQKKILMLLFLFMVTFVLSSCGGAPSGVAVDGDTLAVGCETMGNAGYYWQYSISDQKVLTYQSEEYTATNEYQELTGEVGIQSYTFRGQGEGTTKVTFHCYKPLEETPFQTKEIVVSVDKDGKIIFVEEMNEISRMVDIFI